MTKLTAERRALLISELRTRERFTIKAIALRHGVSRATLWRLQDELRESSPDAALKQFDSDNRDIGR